MDKSTKKLTKSQEKRAVLVSHSVNARAIREQYVEHALRAKDSTTAAFFESQPLNYFIVKCIYTNEENTEFKTFNQWKEDGSTVKKGEKAFLIWGQPRNGSKNHESQEQPTASTPMSAEEQEGSIYEFFPLCYLFSNAQVYKRDPNAETAEQEQTLIIEQSQGLQLDALLG